MTHYSGDEIRKHFPIISNNPGIAYLDSAASSQKPQYVIDRIKHYYENENANVHRGIYSLSERATSEFERARILGAKFFGGVKTQEVIFTKGTTDGINLVAKILAEAYLDEGDEIILSVAEHHSNIVPWQIAAQHVGATIKYMTLNDDLRIDLEQAKSLFTEKTKVLAIAHVSNVLGIIHPVKELCALARSHNAISIIDGAQGAPHLKIDVLDLDCDFYAVSGHKMLGPTGIGMLYGKMDLLEDLPPYQGGGDMIDEVTLEGSNWADLPNKFEAGTPNIAGAIGLGAAMEYLETFDRNEALRHDIALGTYVFDELSKSNRIKLFTKPGDDWVGVVTFFHQDIHPHDLATICADENVCIRAGHHCAQPLMKYLEVPATSRVSPFIYNNKEDVEKFLSALRKAESLFA